jgi:peptidyl-tRNA hydrolase
VGHVLGPFSKAELAELPLLIERSADAVETVLKGGVQAAMNAFNQKDT